MCPETRLKDNIVLAAKCRALRLSFASVVRPSDGGAGLSPSSGGGVAVIAVDPRVRLTLESTCAKGALSVIARRPGAAAVAVIGCYLPPTTARRAHWRPELLEWIADEYQRLRRRYATVVIAGDINARLGSSGTRWTDDVVPPGARPASRAMAAFCEQLGVTPSHGRSPATPGRITSAPIGGGRGAGAESDYILVDANTNVAALPPQSWKTIPSVHTHRIVAADITVSAASAHGALPRHSAPVNRLHLQPQGAAAWANIAHDIESGLDDAVDGGMVALTGLLGSAARTHLSKSRASLRSGVYRRYHGFNVPPSIAEAMARARKTRRHAQHVNATASSDSERAAATALHAEARAMQKAARHAASANVHSWLRGRVTDLCRTRRRDAHALFGLLRRMSPEDPLIAQSNGDVIPDRDGVPATDRFPTFWAGLLRETRPLPPWVGPQRAKYAGCIPHAPADGLDDPISAEEVYRAIFPAKRTGPTPCLHGTGCIPCADYATDMAQWRAGRTDTPPQWTPVLKTSTAAGPDGIPAEVLRFSAPSQPHLRRHYRERVALSIARILSDALAHGTVPPELAEAYIVPILKSAKPGHRIDRSDENAYRGIAVGAIVLKLLSLVLTMRMSHWTIRHGLLTAAQAGFTHRHSSEWHVLTLLETIKARRRSGKDTSVLFVDFRKAYDRVHRGALWVLLAQMGVPPRLVNLLRAWADARTARIRVNGVMSDPFVVDAGLPQGDALSPLLFNLYIETLSRFLSADPRCAGVDVLGMIITHLLYADDLGVLGDSPAALQGPQTCIDEWCRDWLLEVSMGSGKTEAVHYAAGQSDVEAVAHPPLHSTFGPVAFALCYRYLGYVARHDLDGTQATIKLVQRLEGNLHRYFTHNRVVRASPAALQLQLFKTVGAGSINYLRAVLTMDASVYRNIDDTTRRVARSIAGLPSRSATALTWVQSSLLTAAGTVVRERERLFQQLLATPFQGAIAPQLLRRLLVEPRSRDSESGPTHNWAHVTLHMRDECRRRGAVFVRPWSYRDISRCAHVLARSVAYIEVREAAWRAARDDVPGTTISLPPNGRGSLRHMLALRFGLAASPVSLGTRAGYTPISIGGPGCSGSLATIADDRSYPSVACAALGDEALSLPPFAPPRARDGTYSNGDYAARFDRGTCRLCDDSNETLFHLACECTSAPVLRWRANALASLRLLMSTLWEDALGVLERAGIEAPHVAAAPAAATRSFLTGGALPPHERSFILYWMLCATPWPRFATLLPPNMPQFPVANAFGTLFDAIAVRHGLIRSWSATWLSWSEEHIRSLAVAFRDE